MKVIYRHQIHTAKVVLLPPDFSSFRKNQKANRSSLSRLEMIATKRSDSLTAKTEALMIAKNKIINSGERGGRWNDSQSV